MGKVLSELPLRYALAMNVVTEFSLALCCGFLGMGVSAWNSERGATAGTRPEISGFLPAAQWERAMELAQGRGVPILVYAGMTETNPALEEDLAQDPVLQEALSHFVPVAAFLDGADEDRELASRLGMTAAPDFLAVAPAAALSAAPSGTGGVQIIGQLSPLTGSAFERFGLASELWRLSSGAHEAIEPNGHDTSGAGINGFSERYAALQAMVMDFTVPTPGDVETALDIHLATEGNADLRYYGWSWLASWLERCARQAGASGGEHLGVPQARWEARLRATSRRAWISCPESRLLPFGSLLIQRYARAAADLDSLDRAFMAAVIRTLSNEPGALEFPGQQWLAEAKAAASPK